jgi:hypothetical protein
MILAALFDYYPALFTQEGRFRDSLLKTDGPSGSELRSLLCCAK